MSTDTTADLRPPKQRAIAIEIPGYRVLDFLGEGGMGTVYAAEQLNPRRRVAIKVLHSASPTAVARFHTEAEVMARLDHPNIARVLEAGEADGRPYFVMEHVDGQTLDHYVETRPLDERLALFVQICDAVHHAHLKGVIHRDLKPSNVLVRPDGRAVVLDFGIAHLTDRDETAMTRSGEMIGTPMYMSPEQAQQRSHEVDVRTDVYTLGVILYELACNELPYGERGMPVSVLIVAIADGVPIRLARRAPELRGDLEAITEKALEKEPKARYQSVAALGDDVRRFRAHLPVSVRTPGAFERARRFVRRRPLVAALSALAAIATATFATAVTVLWLEARSARRTADEARARAETRTNQLVLRTARAALVRDPTEAIAWIETLTPRGVDAGAAWAIADEAIARGVAADVLHAHRDEVHWVEPFGEGFVSGSYDGRAIVWDPKPRVVFTAKHGRVHAVRPSPSGELAIGGDGGATSVVARDGSITELPGHAGDVQHLAWSSDGAWLVTGDEHGHVWAWPRGRPPGRALVAPGAAIDTLAIYGHDVVSGDREGTLHLVNLDSGAVRDAAAGAGIVDAWTDGARLVAAAADGSVRTWHVDRDHLALDRTVTTSLQIKRAAFPADGSWAVLGGVGGAVLRVAGDTVNTLWTFRDQVRTLAISPDGRYLAFGSDDGSLELRELATGRELALRGHGSRARHLAFARDTLLSADSDGVIRRWNLAAIPNTLLDARAPVDKLASDGAHLATVDANGDVSLWDLATAGGAKHGHVTGRTTALAIAGGIAITGTAEGTVTWWAQPPVEHVLHGIVKAIAASRDRVAVATSSGAIELFTLAGAPVATLDANNGGVEALAFDETGTLLASGGQDRVVRVWRRDGDPFAPLASLAGPQGDTHFVAFASGRLVTAGNDGRVLAWTIRDHAPDPASLQVVAQHTGAITALAVARDHIISAGHDAALIRDGTQAAIPDEAKALAIGDDGSVYAVTRTGAAIRWTDSPDVEIEHGARGLVALPGSRFVLALDDGALLERTYAAGSLDELAALLPRTTSFTIH